MNITKFFQSLKSTFSPMDKDLNMNPLKIDISAQNKVVQHISERPLESIFHISIKFYNERVDYKVGFVEKDESKTKYEYPFPIKVTEVEEEYLRNCTLEYDEKTENFFIYPDVEISVSDTPSMNIYRFIINREVISPKSDESFISVSKDNYPKNIRLLQMIFSHKLVESIYIEKKTISIEFNSEMSKILEEELIDILLKYFTETSYPIGIKNNLFKTFIPNKD